MGMADSPRSESTPVAVVTGGRRGIGRAIALALAARAFDIVVVDLDQDSDATKVLTDIRALGRRAAFVAGDISALDHLPGLVDSMFGQFGRLDCLVNNAGVIPNTRGRDLLDVTPDTFNKIMDVNLRGTFFLTQQVARRMIEAGAAMEARHRCIITITSGAVGKARLDSPEYAFSKTGLSLMSQAFAVRLGPHNIHTYEVRPGVTKTEMSRDVWPMYDKMIEEGRFPIARMALPEDIGNAVAALASGSLPYSSGDYFHIDGGFHINSSAAAKRKS
jgi:NAD(P)-dependent dehydrogenase (short-subunit alcohol dehydrogenase family)